LIRKHTEGLRPPRALCVPFELGRPFGSPNEPDFQRRVLLAVLKLLERNDGPFIEDFPDTPPGPPADMEGWTCPVNLARPATDLSDAEKLALDLKQEVALLRPWYEESVKNFNGRRLDGLTDYSPEEIIDSLVSFVDDPSIASFMAEQPLGRALKLTADDLKHFYVQAAMAKPGNISDIQMGDWFYGETLAGQLFIKMREICLGHEVEALQNIGRTNFVPNAMLKHV
jgi:hypothetical protein